MNIVLLSGSTVGHKTRIAMEAVAAEFSRQSPEDTITLFDLAQLDLQFSDGRNYLDYTGDTKQLTTALMAADGIVIGTPIFQTSIPGSLKNVFDLLPVNAFRDKIASIVVTAGSAKHYLVAQFMLKPILEYMKAHIVQNYVFIEETSFIGQKLSDPDIDFRIERLVEDSLVLLRSYQEQRRFADEQYDF